MDDRTRWRVVADVVTALGAGALLLSSTLPWARRGPGHSLHGHALVDALIALGNTLPGLSAARLTVLWYLIPALGAIIWIALGIAGASHRATGVASVAALASTLLTLVAFDRVLGLDALGSGPFVACMGALSATIGTLVIPRRRDRRVIPHVSLSESLCTHVAGGLDGHATDNTDPASVRSSRQSG